MAGENLLTDIFKEIGGARAAKAAAIGTAARLFTGENPVIQDKGDYTEITFTPGQVVTLRNLLDRWHSAEPGDVRVNVGPVLGPYYLKRYWYYIAGAVALGVLIGGIIKR